LSWTDERPECPMCGRRVRPGIRCQQTTCPWELKVNREGRVVLARPLRQRLK
jgi:hypothetical protein